MKKRLLVLFLAVVGMQMPSEAQTELTYPKFTKVLEVTSKSVNIRKEPSTQSAKLGNSPEYLLVLDENEEWYHACILKEGAVLPQLGYVSKKVCKVKPSPNLDGNYVKQCWDGAGVSIENRTNGKYKGYCIITYYEFYCGAERNWIFIGKNKGNVCIGRQCSYSRVWSDDTEYSLQSNNGEALEVPMSRIGDSDGPDWNKLTDREIDKIMSFDSIELMVAGTQTQAYRDGLGTTTESGKGVVTYSFDKAKYTGETMITK